MSENQEQEPFVFHITPDYTTNVATVQLPQPFIDTIHDYRDAIWRTPAPDPMAMASVRAFLDTPSLEAIRQIVQDEVQKALHPEPEASDYNEGDD